MPVLSQKNYNLKYDQNYITNTIAASNIIVKIYNPEGFKIIESLYPYAIYQEEFSGIIINLDLDSDSVTIFHYRS